MNLKRALHIKYDTLGFILLYLYLLSYYMYFMFFSLLTWEWNFQTISLVVAVCALALLVLLFSVREHSSEKTILGKTLRSKTMFWFMLFLLLAVILGMAFAGDGVGHSYISDPYRQ